MQDGRSGLFERTPTGWDRTRREVGGTPPQRVGRLWPQAATAFVCCASRPDHYADVMTTHSLTASELAASLTVDDLEKSTAWYVDVLGFAVDRKHEREGKLMA